MRPLATDGDVLNSDQTFSDSLAILGSREADREVFPRVILPSRPSSE